ncbi:sodium ion-translocating decarboxylase subunit beta [Bermanella marisrubri]|uniref:Oxaloacetate decarboxylase beta chain n=1 Tax=Bermanella marisrubri TaxID=207949 RepID=Q1N030_9GAMM|nr:sodium ion-translocating decarboxylase subunit beta [Bermanella marisrubri]EAT11533.1 Na+-transporting methylmalonyl-CoA/oxaloacetate decarboxylase, beta subunit [Oceanobacter sp. RED65] [Bermanella marisrubri]QIZ85002.1 sodium ion-translocating decarboxylase subunit beta [Bermanella marisrubri]
METLLNFWHDSGIYQLEPGQFAMMIVAFGMLYLAIKKGFEPLLLLPIAVGTLMVNIPGAGLGWSAAEQAIRTGGADVLEQFRTLLGLAANADIATMLDAYHHAETPIYKQAVMLGKTLGFENGMLYTFYSMTIASGVAPLLIFMGVGAMTDFGPLLANPKTLLLGAAAQFGIFGTVIGAVLMTHYGITDFSAMQAAAIGIIGGADGPTSIFIASKLAPELLGAIAVAAYSYMALVPMIQPPIMKLFTTAEERKIKMEQLRTVSKLEKILFPLAVLVLVAFILPSAAPLLGMFCFGNLMKESGVVERLSDTAQNALINVVTIFLGLSVGYKMSSDAFLNWETIAIIVLGLVAFCVGTAAGVLMAKAMNLFLKTPINPLIGSAGVSAVPMAARVSNKVGLEYNPQNFLLMHAMGPNVAGVIGSAVAAGVMLSYFG